MLNLKHIHYLLIGICVSILLLYLIFGSTQEGFSTFSENVDYTPYFKEVFLVAPDQWGHADNYVNLYGQVKPVRGYTYDAAAAQCATYGGTLATKAQLTMAFNKFGANWCPGGWVQDDKANLYNPMVKNGTCGFPSDTSGVQKTSPYPGGLGYPICYAVKPPNPSPYVRDFNSANFSMVSSDVLTAVTNGPGTDMYPIVFSASQAYWALEQNGYDPVAARSALKDLATRTAYDNAILAVIGGTPMSDALKQTDTTCLDLAAIKADFEKKIQGLETIFSDLSGAVYSAIAAKDENTNYIQAQITSICKNPNISQTTSDACSRLLSLDYDIFYRNLDPTGKTQENLITDLETINIALAMEECTLQQNFSALKVTTDTLCPDTNPPTRSWAILKDNTMDGNMITCSYPTDRSKIPSGAFKVGQDIQMNMVGLFKYDLEQISPYFNTEKYASLITNILNQLSITMRTPPPEQYINAENTFNRANSLAQRVYNLLIG